MTPYKNEMTPKSLGKGIVISNLKLRSLFSLIEFVLCMKLCEIYTKRLIYHRVVTQYKHSKIFHFISII